TALTGATLRACPVRPDARDAAPGSRSAARPNNRARQAAGAGGRTCTARAPPAPDLVLSEIRRELLREHPRVAVGVVERRELHHAVDLVRLPVEACVEGLEVRAGRIDVFDAERRHGAAVLELLALAEADRDAGGGR